MLPAAEIRTVADFHPPEVQCWGHLPLHQSNVQSDQKPFGKFPDFHGFAEIQFYPDLICSGVPPDVALVIAQAASFLVRNSAF